MDPLSVLGQQYQQAYQSALAYNQANAQSIAAGYRQTLASQMSAQQAIAGGYPQLANQIQAQLTPMQTALGQQQSGQQQIQQGYGALQQNVLGTIQGISASQQQAINDTYAQQRGGAAQSLVSRGLGNTTVNDSVQRGLTLDQQKANIALSNQTAQLTAGYQSQLGLSGLNYANQAVTQNTAQQNQMAQVAAGYGSQIGLAGLGYQNQANLQNTGLATQGLNWQNSIQAPYPNAQNYSNLAQQYGAQQQAQTGQQAAYMSPYNQQNAYSDTYMNSTGGYGY